VWGRNGNCSYIIKQKIEPLKLLKIHNLKNSTPVILFRIMKWCVKVVLVITGILPFARCGSGYREKDGKVTFNGEEITDTSFVVLNDVFAKSDSGAYYKRYGIPDADLETFTGLDKHYAKDKATVYYCDEEREGQNYYLTKHSVIIKVRGARPASFAILGEGYEGYAKDDKRAYFKGTGFDVKDVASLSVIDGRFLKDRFHVYFDQAVVKGADPATFRAMKEFYARDTGHVYYYGYHSDLYNGIHEIPCDAATFTILDYPYSKDASAVFYLYTRIKDADAASFSVTGNDFSKDGKQVYYRAKILEGADPATFFIFPNKDSREDINYTKDKTHVYWNDRHVPVADATAFTPLGLDYGTDRKNVYFQTRMVKNADPATFKIYDHGYGDADAEDAKFRYLKGEKLAKE